ncbi:hypothetical protein ACIS_01182 [Anaplasma centrale str. Israel]|uniref:Uncharacterized protein n=1 Tax=Anaplasma centrale (strain Israel) TaxID=574556 RepID=D1AT30_ANACI|nr:hypothetical protein [Anaplasma centrale]ACZ48750.1 hypothetical protein ACIS_00030 [Anaplasma centrale str. Israel]ACZ48761.1 hypothetical protein ACIS_00049 [Anaplasma centrale str. Israel]ACZ49633.1 hypothetical protein ACIS_01175 [Anaplasma centrale str. Israel]ACZ49637.1 hypothetical protein ACIS_01182 [Anaplasma centrale str. Israel]
MDDDVSSMRKTKEKVRVCTQVWRWASDSDSNPTVASPPSTYQRVGAVALVTHVVGIVVQQERSSIAPLLQKEALGIVLEEPGLKLK